ncbi:HAD-IA family hydrolase [Planctobacterium marinum]|nr:HAD-IA family hydrolase [Planctobacterium marinum]
MDGTLVTSQLDFVAMRKAVGCPAEQDILTYIDDIADDQHRHQAIAQIESMELEDAHQSEIIDGVAEALACLQQQDIRTAVVTRNCRAATDIKLQKAGLRFEQVLTRECAPAKPDPTALLQIAKSWSLTPQQTIYVGDYLHDINAAINAGMRSVLMTLQGPPDWAHDATWQFASYAEFLAFFNDRNCSE